MKSTKFKAFSLVEISVVILIIGLLLAGVTNASDMIAEYRIKIARNLTKNAPVARVDGLVLWLDSNALESFPPREAIDGAKINTWYDLNPQTAVKNNAVQASATANLHPTYKENCLNNLPCVNFNGTTNYIDTTQDLGGTTRQVSVFWVALPDTPSTGITGGGQILSTHDLTYDERIQVYMTTSWGVSYFAGVGEIAYTQPIKRKLAVYDVVDDEEGGTLYINKVAKTTVVQSGGYPKAIRIFNIGTWSNNDGTREEYFGGNIGEIIIFNRALLERERKAIEDYLCQKWGVKG